jgi:5-methylcytosine-specific restriction endonuclease McrA
MVEANTVHHIFPVSRYPEYQWCDWNLISLSSEAHNSMHIRDTDELTENGERLMKRTAIKQGIELYD